MRYCGLTLCALVLAASWAAAPASAGHVCGWSGYSYAGIQAAEPESGIAATISALRTPRVQSGHVAAWVGVGGYGVGPRGESEWLQVGLVAVPGSALTLYYEVKRPGRPARYVELERGIGPGMSRRLAVQEHASRPGWWRAWVDGHAVGPLVELRGSHGRFAPIATAESWDGGVPACNRFRFRLEHVAIAESSRAWRALSHGRVLEDPGYRLDRRAHATFHARVAPAVTAAGGGAPAAASAVYAIPVRARNGSTRVDVLPLGSVAPIRSR